MQTITKFLVLLLLVVISTHVKAQDSIKISNNQLKIEALIKQKSKVEADEKELLKAEVEAINKQLESGEITEEESQQLKQEAAQKRALNIENRLAIIDNQIALLKRDANITQDLVLTKSNEKKKDSVKYIYSNTFWGRTYETAILGFGFNNAIIDGQDINDSPYKLGGSGFIELGYAWTTRVFKNSGFLHIKYGASLQWNKLNIKDNQYFVREGDLITLQEFPLELDKAKFRMTNIVFPVHLQFGPSKKVRNYDNIRFSSYSGFRLGIGGYAGFNLGHMQKLKFEENGDDRKDKQRGNFNVNEFIYGLSGYVAIGDVAVYVKYDLNPIFNSQPIDQNNISVGLRLEFD
ncbi:hypothetical protein [Paucihalobacter sp.]|uniref:hypothetical protein n=1 Tax=Paucihalobacter sp. TaxID=2850405 RepID=UPI002FDF2E6B